MEKVVIVIILGIVFGLIKFFLGGKVQQLLSGGELLVGAINDNYKKAVCPNNYPEYTGELEEEDTNEYIKFITPNILNLIK